MTVTNFFEDSEGGRWFSTLDNGVYYMPWDDLWFYHDVPGMCKTLTQHGNEIWAGFSKGTVVQYTDSAAAEIYEIPYSDQRLGVLQSFCESPGQLYAVCSNLVYNLQDKDIKTSRYPEAYVRRLVSDGNNIWGLGNGFYLLRNDSILYSSETQAAFNEWVTAMSRWSDSLYMVGTFNGLYTFNGTTISKYNSKNRLFSHRVSDIKLAGSYRLYTTIGAGLLLEKDTSVFHIQKGDTGLLSNVCNSAFIENDTIIWVATNEGINTIYIHPSSGRLNYKTNGISKEDGLKSNEVYDLLVKDDYVWAGTNQGLVKFRKDMYNYDRYKLPLILHYFKAGDKKADINGAIALTSDQNNVELSYTALFFKNPDKIRYRYRLQPDNDWAYTKNTQIRFLNLAERSYNLQLEASIDNTHWFGLNKSIHFNINPPLWRSTGMQVGYMIVGTLLLWLLFYYQFSIFKKRALLKRKAFEAEQKALRAQINPHFIFNSLNSINSFILGNDRLIASQYLAKFSGLMRQMLDSSAETTIPIKKEIDALSSYMAMEALRVDNKFSFHITYDPALDIEKCHIPPMLIQPFVENAIWHGIMPLKGRKGVITIHFTSLSHYSILCTVEDNGVGREAQKGRKKPVHRSHGMLLIKNRLAIISEIRKDNYYIKTLDMKNEDGSAAGTKIKLTLPANYDQSSINR